VRKPEMNENGLGNLKIEFTKEGRCPKSSAAIRRERPGLAQTSNAKIGRVCRKIARSITEGEAPPESVTPDSLHRLPGPAQVSSRKWPKRNARSPVGRGRVLAWTPNGGDILFIESTRMKWPEKASPSPARSAT